MEPYCGHTHLPETGLGQQEEVHPGCTFVHDNLFTSLSLIDEVTKQGYGSLGTLRQYPLHDVPFKGVKEFEKKMPLRSTEVLIEGEKLLVQWKGNSVVTMATNDFQRFKHPGGAKRKSLCQSATASVFPKPKQGQHGSA